MIFQFAVIASLTAKAVRLAISIFKILDIEEIATPAYGGLAMTEGGLPRPPSAGSHLWV